MVVLSLQFAVTFSGSLLSGESPDSTVISAGASTDVIARTVTSNSALRVLSIFAVIVVVPTDLAVITPLLLTVATPGSEDSYVKPLCIFLYPEKYAQKLRSWMSPLVRVSAVIFLLFSRKTTLLTLEFLTSTR